MAIRRKLLENEDELVIVDCDSGKVVIKRDKKRYKDPRVKWIEIGKTCPHCGQDIAES